MKDNPWSNPFEPTLETLSYEEFACERIAAPYGFGCYLPPDYERDVSRRYPVVYWLHGADGGPSTFLQIADLVDGAVREGRAPAMIVIAVNGLSKGMYCDSKDGKFPVETVIMKDVIPYVESRYRTLATREMRAVEGFSMGGFGAARLALKYPSVFGSLSVFCGAFHQPEFIQSNRKEIFENVFGNDLEYCRIHSPWTLLEEGSAKALGRTAIRITVGENDRLRVKNRKFHERLDSLDIPHDYLIVPDMKHVVRGLYENYPGDLFAFYRRQFALDDPAV